MNGRESQWHNVILIFRYISLKMAVLLHKTILVNFPSATTLHTKSANHLHFFSDDWWQSLYFLTFLLGSNSGIGYDVTFFGRRSRDFAKMSNLWQKLLPGNRQLSNVSKYPSYIIFSAPLSMSSKIMRCCWKSTVSLISTERVQTKLE